jgi:benzoyl-CoA reductase/2-hydroxyglutaryl-CoA dehydratase subunit BcrC/BadD/HgdB
LYLLPTGIGLAAGAAPVSLCGTKEEPIAAAIDVVNRETQAAKALCDLNKSDPPALNGLDLLTVNWSRGFAIDKTELAGMLEELTTSLKTQTSENVAGQPRILLTGCPVGLGTEKVIRLVDELGGNVVCMENCTGYKTLSLQSSREFADPIEALAQGLPPGGISYQYDSLS